MGLSERTKDILEWLYCIIIAVVLALLVRYYIGTPTMVKQPSMYPTLKENQRLILNRWPRTTNKMPKRGDIVTFESPSKVYVSAYEVDLDNPVAEYRNGPTNFFSKFRYYVLEIGKKSFIKRVIALPGEYLKIENGKVYVNGEELQEDYLQPGVITDSLDGCFIDLTVPEGYVFVMGDNRNQSSDSRAFGCIPVDKLEGTVVLRFWPLDMFGKVE